MANSLVPCICDAVIPLVFGGNGDQAEIVIESLMKNNEEGEEEKYWSAGIQ